MHEFETKGNTARISNDFKVDTRTSQGGKSYRVAQFDIACATPSYKNAKGEWVKQEPRYFTVRTGVDFLIEKIGKKAKKGALVYLTGTPVTWSVKNQDGSYRNGFYISLDKNDSLDIYEVVKEAKTETKQESADSTPYDSFAGVDISNDDLPFDI